MLSVTLICVGKMKERFYIDAAAEYSKRLGAYCKLDIIELPEAPRSTSPSAAEISAAMKREASAIFEKIPKGAAVVAMCVEGKQRSSEAFSSMLQDFASSGASRVCFIIGGSDGLDDSVKKLAAQRLSMSEMTFPHHLARVMLLEQIYRGFKIAEGGRYHK